MNLSALLISVSILMACCSRDNTHDHDGVIDSALSAYCIDQSLNLDSVVLLSKSVTPEGVDFNKVTVSSLEELGYRRVSDISSLISSSHANVIESERVLPFLQKGYVALGLIRILENEGHRVVEFQVFCEGGYCCNYDMYHFKQNTNEDWVLVEVIESSINC